MRVTYGLAEEILASQEEVCCLKPVVTLTPDTNSRLFILFQQPIDSASVTDGVQWISNQQDSWCQLGPLVCSDSRILN
jgi:hypothetical protein